MPDPLVVLYVLCDCTQDFVSCLKTSSILNKNDLLDNIYWLKEQRENTEDAGSMEFFHRTQRNGIELSNIFCSY